MLLRVRALRVSEGVRVARGVQGGQVGRVGEERNVGGCAGEAVRAVECLRA